LSTDGPQRFNGTLKTATISWRSERVVEGLQGFLLQVEVAEIIVHEAGEPNAFVDLLDSEPLTGEHGGDVAPLDAGRGVRSR
jgi:hypothetical protein